MTFTMETNVKEVAEFFKRLSKEIETAAENTAKKCGNRAVERASRAIKYQNPGMVGSNWASLSRRYMRTARKRHSRYPDKILKLDGRMMNQFYRTKVMGTFRFGGVWVSVSNRVWYFPLMELGGVDEHGFRVPARPSLLPLEKYGRYLNECKNYLRINLYNGVQRAKLGLAV